MKDAAQPDVIVIGAGVVGLSAAIAVQARGLSVTVLDREGPAAGASAGNAGAFAFTDILPLASPGILKKAPKWLLDPLGPLSVPPAYAAQIAPWMFRFWRACSPSRVAHSTAAQTAIMDLSKAELEPFLSATGTLPMLRKEGNLQVYESDAELKASLPGWKARAEHGIEFRHMGAAEMAAIQPGIASRFTCGTFTPGWYSIADPKLYTLALADHFRAKGGTIERAEITALKPIGGGVELTTADGETRRAGQVVLSAGAFSHQVARSLGERIPLETERGYNTTLPSNAFDLRTQVTFGGHGFVVTRLTTGIRVGGAVELGGLKLPPNFRRSEAMLKKAKAFLPGLKSEGGVQWMGFRPSLPDSLPAIGRARATERVIYAFGHGHLGLTQSAGTARLVADLLTGHQPAIDIKSFSPQRF
ncbi:MULTISPECIES: FAD-binding oxidoreductase [unclassified Ensifer]|uniref:NAD(P)/FAD-dependent oxidoreductase n=1 Tax=unclassified Ensifer TaxID=2633371 RepID=UPI000813BDDC|nr:MULTISPECIES: FAD-binding oxidoreductase [unclassified Ensifer]OCO99942.1 amino acid dehydrogenase [Ensifer sp. LC13]OCP00118.1 amino acid dehydrogenase [Ensifer sp. LC11]OCP04028.1 amino acid dehydrogenase [Ensifer sp. LC14]OCP31009.1 amino acid dehydrogenase [Ensifer sp. LC499]